MGARTVKHLQEALRGIERDMAVCAAQMEQLKDEANALRGMIARRIADAEGDPRQTADPAARGTGARSPRSDTKVARNALYEILREVDRPMHARDLLTELGRRGVGVVGKDPVNNVRSHLSHDTRFLPVGGGKWDLASRVNRLTLGPAPTHLPRPAIRVIGAPTEPQANDDGLEPDPPEDDWLSGIIPNEEREDTLTNSRF